MAFILSAERGPETCVEAFRRYREYVATRPFPPGAAALARSDWYFGAEDHRCPHDAWLESITISEPSTGEHHERRATAIRIRLLGAYHDGFIEFFYPQVFSYALTSVSSVRGLGDWRYDEFRLSSNGHLIHEIEWRGFPLGQDAEPRWIIEASDVEFTWIPC